MLMPPKINQSQLLKSKKDHLVLKIVRRFTWPQDKAETESPIYFTT